MFPDFNRLKIFHYIFTYKSVASAARELHITQSAVSQHLQKLESEIKTQLFTRLHKRLVPTPAAEKLNEVVQPFIKQLEEGIQNIHQSREGPVGLLRIGAPVEFGKRYIPRVFSSFRGKYPEVTCYLRLGHPTALLPMLAEGLIDFAYADIFQIKGDFSRSLSIYSIEPFINEELILACSKTYYERNLKKENSYNNLIKAQFISYQKEYPAIKSWFKHHFRKESLRLNIVFTVENVEGVIEGVRHHLGFGVIPLHLIHDEIDKGEFIQIKKASKELVNRISLVQLQDKIPSITEKLFIEYFNQKIRKENFPF
jgi:DNA-binding transcriptional LysR family regulator